MRSRSSFVAPLYETRSLPRVDHRQNADPENHTISGKHSVTVAAEEAHQDRYCQPTADRGGSHTYYQGSNRRALLHGLRGFIDDCRERDRHAHQETESRRRGPVEAQETSSRNGCARPRHAWNQSNHLRETNEGRIDPAHLTQRSRPISQLV